MGHVVHSGASGVRNINALFFMLGWDQYRFHKKRAGTRYAKLVFLHLVGCAGHIVHSGASTLRNIDALFSCSGGTCTDSTKSASGHVMPNLCFTSGGICGSRKAVWCVRGEKRLHTIFHAKVGPIQIQQKARQDMLCRTCVFASSWMYGSRSERPGRETSKHHL
jgi:hypothetical protein